MNKLTKSFSINVLLAVLQDLKEGGYRNLSLKDILHLLVFEPKEALVVMKDIKDQAEKNLNAGGNVGQKD